MRIQFTPIVFPDNTKPHGALSRDWRSQACWYFYTLAQKQKEMIGDSIEDQVILEGELWMEKRYRGLAQNIAHMYALESPDEFAKAWDEVREEARACGLPEPAEEYTRLAPRILPS